MARTRKRPKRTRLSTGVYADCYGISLTVRGREHRYPLGTPLAQLRRTRKDLLDDAGPASRRGTLQGDCADHLRTIPEGRARDDAAAMLAHWCAGFGDRASGDLQPKEIKAQRAAWLKTGPNGAPFSKKHLNNMLHALRAVYRTNYGTTLNPALDVPVFTVKYSDARAIPNPLITRIIDGMPDRGKPANGTTPTVNLSKLRLRVMADTGLSQAMLKRVELHHLDVRKKQVYVRMRLKGRGVVGATVPLLDAGVAAFKALVHAGGLGPFSTRSLAYCWRRAVEREKAVWMASEATKRRPRPWPLPDDVRAYDLRHSFGTAILVVTGDLEATATLMRHANINTTRRYIQAAANIRARRAVQQVNRSRLP